MKFSLKKKVYVDHVFSYKLFVSINIIGKIDGTL